MQSCDWGVTLAHMASLYV
ncbi:Protein of unknown function [Pyronema omphalodes CBS 100304]|uniref:Uncharacterized protein n=1 Tax=Pyronema omphalodes (strain CBS 100304) TaxID=1076935 RepID=U4L704_PYROM|nr:Protein of unknown function [Pyronema omphalodes CBS 100304]